MGGIGSGRHWHFGAHETTGDYRAIDIRRWKRDGLLVPGQTFGWQWLRNDEVIASIRVQTQPDRVNLIYRHRSGGGDWQDESYPIFLDSTDCHLGGQRPWFLCPAAGCGKRVAILYGGKIFACRHCYQLAYESQRETDYDRAARRANKIRRKLDWEEGILNSKGWKKPKGMHWKTFEQLNRDHDYFQQTALNGIAARFNMLGESLDDWM
ncbi:MAG: hypothetical protein HN382_11800 [Gammaproteobacteria bacterium]|nr:hypothetical protein [Gammaproteobacteria bacterium]MBT4607202.1 hypothetical protein [Thiotrichales bacterium]MBT3473568.1 hypothetical protein [Gammaproteobacteria bacterium]MBT3717355.1 hypothetical protein [Gammaproteobacteria bacterium]MBT4079728.1 hypothetical protein [Gammaproteobacteria bacterium]